jgi:hypothetical protein
LPARFRLGDRAWWRDNEIAPDCLAEPAACDQPVSPQQRMAIAPRIMSVAEREMDAVARIVGSIKPADQVGAEQGTRTMTSVSRTPREIAALIKPEHETPDGADDHAIPWDIDAFRDELARRINKFVDARRSGQGGTGGATVVAIAGGGAGALSP